jgi:hypothetical protein
LEVVKEVYGDVLLAENVGRIQLLETSKYLEAYLWPNVTAANLASKEFLLSIVAMINEKFRER